ncbi:unnamed protein product [Eruca vesicaria subsp. sativa]|uniref:Uncharacterized protein n=1 Tax=Eruca vesicaria subsp. sativa TaxID=29727 RepID=A0ABC8LNW3_ERUVS|nr:unnamed protein product [Eruca vesicaria subsp. sativa]
MTSPPSPPAFITDIEIKRLSPGGPDNATPPSNPPPFVTNIEMKEISFKRSKQCDISTYATRFTTDIEIKRLVPRGPNNVTSPPTPPASIPDIEMKRKFQEVQTI